MKTKELLKKIRNELENSEEELDVETISEKLKITKKECMDLLEYLGIDVIDEEVNDDLNESVITEDEKKNYQTEIIAEKITFLSSKKQEKAE